MIEAVGLEDEAVDLMDETGMEIGFLIALYENARGGPPGEDLGETYHEEINSPDLPVLSDTEEGILEASSYPGSPLPGKCALSPEMEILRCAHGHGNETLVEAILDHAGQ